MLHGRQTNSGHLDYTQLFLTGILSLSLVLASSLVLEIVFSLFATSSVHAGIILTSPIQETDVSISNHDYPDSQFGSPPAEPDLVEWGQIESASSVRGLASADSSSPQKLNPIAIAEKHIGTKAGVQEVALIASDLGFFPSTLFVTQGIPVKIFVTSTSKKLLCLMSDTLALQREVQSQKIAEIDFTPTKSGQHRLYCPINGMEGTLLVKEGGVLGR